MRNLGLTGRLVLSFVAVAAFGGWQPATAKGHALASVKYSYSCARAINLRKSHKAFKKLLAPERRIVARQAFHCLGRDQDAKKTVFIANSIPTKKEDRVFAGTIDRQDLERALDYCVAAGKAAGVTLAVSVTTAGAVKAGSTVFKYSDVACEGLATAFENDNAMAVLGPTQIVASAVTQKALLKRVLRIPLVDKKTRDKLVAALISATQPPELRFDRHKNKVHVDLGLGGGFGVNIPKIGKKKKRKPTVLNHAKKVLCPVC